MARLDRVDRAKARKPDGFGTPSLTWDEAQAIRARYRPPSGGYMVGTPYVPGNGRALAREFGVSDATVYRILHNPAAYPCQ